MTFFLESRNPDSYIFFVVQYSYFFIWHKLMKKKYIQYIIRFAFQEERRLYIQ